MDKQSIQAFLNPDEVQPQLETESLFNATGDIGELLAAAPPWHGSYAPELLTLVRQHVVLRSAIGLALEQAQTANMRLRTAATWDEAKELQGFIKGLELFHQTLIIVMRSADKRETESHKYAPEI